VEVYEEAAGVWRKLPKACDMPRDMCQRGSALM